MMGHSLGAAVAALAAEQASDRGNPPTSVYVYGMPRIGSSQFKARYDTKLGDRTYRLVHGRDLVAAVPPPSLGFAHVGRLLRCGPGDKFDAAGTPASPGSDQPTLAPQVLESIKGQFLALRSGHLSSPVGPGRFGALFRLLPPSIRDHLQDRYLNALGANISF